MALTPNSTLADLPGTTPTAEIDNVANQAQIRAAIGAVGTESEITVALDPLSTETSFRALLESMGVVFNA